MTTVLLTGYILMWPVLVAIIAYVIAHGFFKDLKRARDEGDSVV